VSRARSSLGGGVGRSDVEEEEEEDDDDDDDDDDDGAAAARRKSHHDHNHNNNRGLLVGQQRVLETAEEEADVRNGKSPRPLRRGSLLKSAFSWCLEACHRR